MRRATLDRLLLGAAAAFALAGVAALAWPAPVDVAPRRLALAPLGPVSADTAAADDSAHVATIVQANVFAESRRPPAVRYDPTGGGAAVQDEVTPTPPTMTPAEPTPVDSEAPAPFAPTLYGIVADPQGGAPVALLRLDPHIPGARAYHAGDRAGAYRVVSVGADEVLLDGPSGRRTLRLRTSP